MLTQVGLFVARVSVVVPTYNCGRWLPESLDSVLGQTAPPWEVVVVDDGSTDDTPAVLARYGERIRVVPGAHGGLSAARNLGLDAARGDVVAFHDADDVATPDRLAYALDFLASHPQYDAVFCNGERMQAPSPERARVVPPEFAGPADGRPLDAVALFDGFPIYFQGALVPRRAFVAAGRFDAAFRVQPDIEYAYRLLAHVRAAYVDRVVFRYRWHTTNNSRDRLGGREDIARILERLETVAPAAVTAIGRGRLRRRLARHWFRIGRIRLGRHEPEPARAALARAAALQPWHPRYQWHRLRHAT